jgi:hypothetical protein
MKIQRQSLDKNGGVVWNEAENEHPTDCDKCGEELFLAPDGETVFCYCQKLNSKKK